MHASLHIPILKGGGVTRREVFNPVGVGANSGELPVLQVGLVASLDRRLVDGVEDICHCQVCVVVTVQVPASSQSAP